MLVLVYFEISQANLWHRRRDSLERQTTDNTEVGGLNWSRCDNLSLRSLHEGHREANASFEKEKVVNYANEGMPAFQN